MTYINDLEKQNEELKQKLAESQKFIEDINNPTRVLMGDADLIVNLRMLGHGKDSFRIDVNCDEEQVSITQLNPIEPSSRCYDDWIAQLRYIANVLAVRKKRKENEIKDNKDF
jgi:hypothetical protein